MPDWSSIACGRSSPVCPGGIGVRKAYNARPPRASLSILSRCTATMNIATRLGLSPTLILSLLAVYFIWGSTYLAIRFALDSYPPLFFPGLRFLVAGSVLFLVLKLRGYAMPRPRQWAGAMLIGTMMLVVGNGGVVFAQQSVGSGLAATAVSTVPLWASLMAGIWGIWPRPAQWAGIALGLFGVLLLNLGGDFAGNPLAAGLLMLASLCWSLGTVISTRLPMPAGLMSSACQMLWAGVLFLALSAARGEPWQIDASPKSLAALLYLIVFGSLIAYSAFVYLIHHATPVLSTSYAYVNPVIAVLLGVAFAGEELLANEWAAIALVLAGVVLMVVNNRGQKR